MIKRKSILDFSDAIVVDGKGHLLGRLASKVAKQILLGYKVVVVSCELIEKSGPLRRNKQIFKSYLRKRNIVNPRRGPFHFRAPSMMFYKAVRGMIRRKTTKGKKALERLKVYNGVPEQYNLVKKYYCPSSLRNLRLNPRCKYTVMGELASLVGWTMKDTVERLEKKRIEFNKKLEEKKAEEEKLRQKAIEACGAEIKQIDERLAEFGY